VLQISAIRAAIAASPHRHYVYILCYADGRPFYVGKGAGSRVFEHESEARNLPTRSHKLNVIRAILRRGQRIGYVLDGFFADERDALAHERALIQRIGRHDLGTGPLTNQTDGGEGTSNPSQESRARRAATLGGDADDPDRRAINQFFHSLGHKHDSIPIKPLGARTLVPLTPHPSPRSPTVRMAQTLLASAVARGVLLRPGCEIPRRFAMNATAYVIENGVGRDMLKAGLVTLKPGAASPEDEILALTKPGHDYVISAIGRDRLLDLGVLEPGL